MATLKVAVVGAGNVGTTLGKNLLKNNAALVKYGTRDPTSDKAKKLLEDQPAASVASVQDAITWADAVILTTPSSTTTEAGIKDLAASLLPAIKGKVLLDAVNPVSGWPALEFDWKSGTSGGERVAAALPDTHVFKAFNTLGENMMQVPDGSTLDGEQLTLMFAGPQEGKDIAEQVIVGTGFKPVYVGPIRYSRNLEALAELWIHLGVPPGGGAGSDKWGRNFHFQVLRK